MKPLKERDEVYLPSSIETQEEIKNILFETPLLENNSLWNGIPQIEKLKEIREKRHLFTIFELYSRYRKNPKKDKEFNQLDEILKNPVLLSFWLENLEIGGWRRHRLRNQPIDEPDQRHPFDMQAGAYYGILATERGVLVKHYLEAREAMAAGKYRDAFKAFKEGINHYSYELEQDKNAKQELQEQVSLLESDIASKEVFKKINEIMKQVMRWHAEDLGEGMRFNDFRCFYVSQAIDQRMLGIMISEQTIQNRDAKDLKQSLSQEATELIKSMGNRIEQFANIHIYPSYIYAAHNYYIIGQAYMSLALSLMSDDLINQNKFSKTCSQESFLKNSFFGSDPIIALEFYSRSVRDFFNQALTYAKAAEKLQQTGNYEDIAYNANTSKLLDQLMKFEGEDHETIGSFVKHLEDEIKKDWQELTKVVSTTQSYPTESQEDIETIVEKHSYQFDPQSSLKNSRLRL